MKQHQEIIKKVLEEEEKILRQQILELADKRDYHSIVFDNIEKNLTMGESLNAGLNSRWLNILRLLSVGDFSVVWILQEVGRNDPILYKKLIKALP